MRFVKNFTPPDFQAKDFTPLISTALVIKTQKMSIFQHKGAEVFALYVKQFSLPPSPLQKTNHMVVKTSKGKKVDHFKTTLILLFR